MEWLFLVLISAVFLAFRAIFTKKLLVDDDELPVLFYLSILSAAAMAFFYRSISLQQPLLVYGLILLKSSVISVAWFCLYKAYKNLEISTVSPLRNLSPIFLIVLSYAFLGEQVSTINYLGIILLIIAAYLLETGSFSSMLEPFRFFKTRYFLLIVISLIGNSISAVLDKMILQTTNTYSLMFLFYIFLSIIFLAALILKKETKALSSLAKRKNIFLIIAMTLSALIADLTYFMAVAIPGTFIVLIIPLRRLSTFISTFIGGRLFHEKNLLHKSIICLIMIFGVFLITL